MVIIIFLSLLLLFILIVKLVLISISDDLLHHCDRFYRNSYRHLYLEIPRSRNFLKWGKFYANKINDQDTQVCKVWQQFDEMPWCIWDNKHIVVKDIYFWRNTFHWFKCLFWVNHMTAQILAFLIKSFVYLVVEFYTVKLYPFIFPLWIRRSTWFSH